MPTLPTNTGPVIRLRTQIQRARFVWREIQSQGLTCEDVADETGLCGQTVRNFVNEDTKYPRMETVVGIFGALGYDVIFSARKAATRGRVAV
jgi:predicted transcriptional regulator